MPKPIQTPRLTLLPTHKDLAPAVANYYYRNRYFLRNTEPARELDFFTLETQTFYLKQEMLRVAQGVSYRFYITRTERPDQIIGLVGLSNIVYDAFQSSFLGYKLDGEYINQGYATEAIQGLVTNAFETLKLHRIEANVMPRNTPSLRVLEKCGFKNEGISSDYLYINGKWEDHMHLVKLNHNWEP